MSSEQAQLSITLRALRGGIDDGRSVTWEADQALKGARGAMHRASGAGAPLGGADALLAGAMRSLDEAERRRQSAARAVDRWLALHGAAGGSGGGAGSGGTQGARAAGGGAVDHVIDDVLAALGGAPTARDGAPGYFNKADEEKRYAVTLGSGLAVEVLASAASAIVPGAGETAHALERAASALIEAVASEGVSAVLESGGERLLRVGPERGSWSQRNDWRWWAAVFAANAFVSGMTGGASLWVTGPLSMALNVAGWIVPKRT